MRTIHKYPLGFEDSQFLELPLEARFLFLGAQNGKLMLWFLLDDSETRTKVEFIIKGTGVDCSDVEDCRFIGTIQLNYLIWHVFHRIP